MRIARPTNLVDWFEYMQLKQEAPRVRSYWINNTHYRLSFPWVSTGRAWLGGTMPPPRYRDTTNRNIYCFFHNEPWGSLAEAPRILRLPPKDLSHLQNHYGRVCVGKWKDVLKLSPSQAFWLTSTEVWFALRLPAAMAGCSPEIPNFIPRSMLDIGHPEKVLKTRWIKPQWPSFPKPKSVLDLIAGLDESDSEVLT